MGLSKEQQSNYIKRIRVFQGPPAAKMGDETVAALVCRTARDVVEGAEIENVPEDLSMLASYGAGLPELYETDSPSEFALRTKEPPLILFDKLVNCGVADVDTYFYCLAELHKRRTRYANILSNQSIPQIEQVGPRAMLQYGQARPEALATLLAWRKWIYDIDNRSAQETGYVFEPALAGALGGVNCSARTSPIKRSDDPTKGRQVDCILENASGAWAYEFKIRVTIAASGQGRWGEEIRFPKEAQAAGYIPVLIVFDATNNVKLTELAKAYRDCGGEAYIGEDAWQHLENRTGSVMALFVEKYMRTPLIELLVHEPNPKALPSIEFSMREREIVISIEGSPPMTIKRDLDAEATESDGLW